MNKIFQIKKAVPTLIVISMVCTFAISISTVGAAADPSSPIQTGNYTVLSPLPCIAGNGVVCQQGKSGDLQTSVNINSYLQYTFNLFIALAAVASVFMITLGGFQYMTTDALQGKEEGREKISRAVKGLILVLASYLILRTINPQFVNIPANLVEPLNLTGKTNALIDTLENDIWNKYKANVTETLAANNELQKKIDSNMALMDQYTQQSNDAEMNGEQYPGQIQDLENKKAALLVENANTLNQINYNKAAALMDSVSKRCLTESASECAYDKAQVAQYYKEYRGQMNDEQRVEIAKKGIYLQADAEINNQLGMVNTASKPSLGDKFFGSWIGGSGYNSSVPLNLQKENAINRIEATVKNYAARPDADPEYLAQLKTSRDSAIKAINAVK
jgi:hypothetical protein